MVVIASAPSAADSVKFRGFSGQVSIRTRPKNTRIDAKSDAYVPECVRMETKRDTNAVELPDTATAMAKTTTISTIAVQSGKTRIVIALLHVRLFLAVSIMSRTPE